MWYVERMRRLLLQRGACVQAEVAFGAAESSGPSQKYLFEANVPGLALRDDAEEDPEVSFLVSDLNRMTGGGFWGAATRVPCVLDAGCR